METLFDKKWDILCVVEHYAGQLSHHYSSVVMIICELFCPHIVYNDPYKRLLVMDIKYFEVLIWLVGIYAPNNANHHVIELWSSIYPMFSMGHVGFLMRGLICVLMHHSTSRFSFTVFF